MPPGSTWTALRTELHHHGWKGATVRGLYKLVNRLGTVNILQVMKVTPPELNPEFADPSTPYEFRFVRATELPGMCARFGDLLPAGFVETALGKGDECLAAFDGSTCAAFGWYSRRPSVFARVLELQFAPGWIYMYHGYTHPAYRGQRLHGLGIARALLDYTRRGERGLVSLAETTNLNTLKSAYRMGFKACGKIGELRLGKRSLIVVTRACRPYGIRVTRLDGVPG